MSVSFFSSYCCYNQVRGPLMLQRASISIHSNEAILFHIHEGNVANGQNRISFTWIEEMNAGEILKLFVVSNKLYANEENLVTFHGFSLVKKLLFSLLKKYKFLNSKICKCFR